MGIVEGASRGEAAWQPEGTAIGDGEVPRAVARMAGRHSGWMTHPTVAAMDAVARGRGDDRHVGPCHGVGVVGLLVAVAFGAWILSDMAGHPGGPANVGFPWQVIPLALGALAFLLGFTMADAKPWREDARVRGKAIPPDKLEFLVRPQGLASFRYDGEDWSRNDLAAADVKSATFREEGDLYVTVTIDTVDGAWVLPWIPGRPELVGTIRSWCEGKVAEAA